jgi:hypothetical protein
MHDRPVALVTGANKGIGLQIAKDLAARGFTVLVGSRNLGHGETAAKGVGAAPGLPSYRPQQLPGHAQRGSRASRCVSRSSTRTVRRARSRTSTARSCGDVVELRTSRTILRLLPSDGQTGSFDLDSLHLLLLPCFCSTHVVIALGRKKIRQQNRSCAPAAGSLPASSNGRDYWGMGETIGPKNI